MVAKSKLVNTNLMVYWILEIVEVWHYKEIEKYDSCGQQNNVSKTVILDNPKEYCDFVFDPMNLVKSINLIDDALIAITYTQQEDSTEIM
uniref:Uncharacterized protein n=1 Tax=Romanomermis culicivorax TaxID=13658 RepID=A0A915ITS3_ROMCU